MRLPGRVVGKLQLRYEPICCVGYTEVPQCGLPAAAGCQQRLPVKKSSSRWRDYYKHFLDQRIVDAGYLTRLLAFVAPFARYGTSGGLTTLLTC